MAVSEKAKMAASPAEPQQWDFMVGPAGYRSEYHRVGRAEKVYDYLQVEAYAQRLAELIALEETQLPLAIGLFGDWGSGKSHFMSLMDQHIKRLTDGERKRSLSEPRQWCREIVPIYFNAWHYLDANLWASLITEIFQGFFAHLAPKKDELELMREQLQEATTVAKKEQPS